MATCFLRLVIAKILNSKASGKVCRMGMVGYMLTPPPWFDPSRDRTADDGRKFSWILVQIACRASRVAQHLRHGQHRPQRGETETSDQRLNTAVPPAFDVSLVGDGVDEDEGVGVVSFWQCMSEYVPRSRSRRRRGIGAANVKSEMLQRHDKVHGRDTTSKVCERGPKGLVKRRSGVFKEAMDWPEDMQRGR